MTTVCLADWPVGDGKETEPEVLKAHLNDLFALWPSLQVLTGDALFCQRPPTRAIIGAGRNYVLAVKGNRPDLDETIRAALADATPATADVTTRDESAGRGTSSPAGTRARSRRPSCSV